MAEPTPTEVAPWYLRNINQALALNSTTGEVYVRTGIEGDVTITGPVTIPGSVEISNDIGNPIPISSNTTANGAGNPLYVNVTNTPLTVNQGTNPWTVGGTVNIGTMPEVEIKNDSGNPVPVSGTITANQGTSPWVVSGTVNTNITGGSVTLAASQTDAFGRLRVSNPFTLFDTQARYYDHGQFNSSTSIGGSVSYQPNSSTFVLSVTGTLGSEVVRETMKVFPYQPGKSLLVMNTFSMATPVTGLRQRVGFFGAQNGIYFETSGTTYNLVIRSYCSGAVVEDRIPQSAWNGDRLTGSGGANNLSGIQLNPALDQIFWMDVEWLGVGSVRCGFVINGTFYLCHTFNHANTPSNPGVTDNTTTYMTTATLPIRYEITNIGAVAGASMRQICSTVISEGGYSQEGITEAAGTGIANPKTLTAKETYYAIASIRLASGRLDAIVWPSQIDVLAVGENYLRWVLLKNATLTDATWAGTSTTGTVQYDTAATTVSGGTEIQSGFAFSRLATTLGAGINFQDQLGRTIAGVSDTFTLAVAAESPSVKVYGQLGWQELT